MEVNKSVQFSVRKIVTQDFGVLNATPEELSEYSNMDEYFEHWLMDHIDHLDPDPEEINIVVEMKDDHGKWREVWQSL